MKKVIKIFLITILACGLSGCSLLPDSLNPFSVLEKKIKNRIKEKAVEVIKDKLSEEGIDASTLIDKAIESDIPELIEEVVEDSVDNDTKKNILSNIIPTNKIKAYIILKDSSTDEELERQYLGEWNSNLDNEVITALVEENAQADYYDMSGNRVKNYYRFSYDILNTDDSSTYYRYCYYDKEYSSQYTEGFLYYAKALDITTIYPDIYPEDTMSGQIQFYSWEEFVNYLNQTNYPVSEFSNVDRDFCHLDICFDNDLLNQFGDGYYASVPSYGWTGGLREKAYSTNVEVCDLGANTIQISFYVGFDFCNAENLIREVIYLDGYQIYEYEPSYSFVTDQFTLSDPIQCYATSGNHEVKFEVYHRYTGELVSDATTYFYVK